MLKAGSGAVTLSAPRAPLLRAYCAKMVLPLTRMALLLLALLLSPTTIPLCASMFAKNKRPYDPEDLKPADRLHLNVRDLAGDNMLSRHRTLSLCKTYNQRALQASVARAHSKGD